MSYALVDKGNNQTIQFVKTEEECFETHEDYKWYIPDDWVMEEGTNPPDFFGMKISNKFNVSYLNQRVGNSKGKLHLKILL